MSLAPPRDLPTAADEPRRAWANGWWSGIAVGVINGLGAAVLVASYLGKL